jgi:7-carboxy-7-deazaguanine synthase
MDLYVTEIFKSIQGESKNAGYPALFIRLSECNLRCSYCDTQYAYSKGEQLSIDEIIHKVKKYPNLHHIAITGGEPLLQKNVLSLIEKLLSLRYKVQLETNGSLPIKKLPRECIKIVDIKTPSSNEEQSFCFENLKYLTSQDELKFVVADKKDFKFAIKFIDQNLKNCDSVINFSPSFNELTAPQLAELIIKEDLNVRLNMQLHKIIWPEGEPRTLEKDQAK